MIQRLLFLGTLVLSFQSTWAQVDSTRTSNFDVSGNVVLRSMRTQNKGDLEDFYVTIGLANVNLSYQTTPWLKLTANGYGLTHFGLSGLQKIDKSTLNGPIYERNLWNPIWFKNDAQFQLTELKADLSFGKHQLTIGRFLFKSPLINSEIWPFKNANEGIAYVFDDPDVGIKLDATLIWRKSTRFDATFRSVGDSFGRGGIGFGVDGNLSRYTGNVNSDYLAMLGLDWQVNQKLSISLWNQFADNVMYNVLIEPRLDLSNGWSINTMYVQQFKINDGGNADPNLTYLPDDRAAYLGLRLNKKVGRNQFQLNFSRVLDQGRLQLTRDWGIEPFYTLQRRTRIEGTQNATVIMFKWEQQFQNRYGQFRWFSSISRAWLPFPDDYEQSKYRLPSYSHLDHSFQFKPNGVLKGLSAEVYLAYRFLAEDLEGNDRYLINRADFFHTDVILSYNF